MNPLNKKSIQLGGNIRIDLQGLWNLVAFRQKRFYKPKPDKKLQQYIQKKSDLILSPYHYKIHNAIQEFLDYDFEGLIEFIEINLPYNRKLEKEKEDYRLYLKLRKKFAK